MTECRRLVKMEPSQRHAVSTAGPIDGRPLVFAHGFGCDQAMWLPVATRLPEYRTILFDLVGFGRSDLSAYDPQKYSTLEGHAEDVVELCRELELDSPVFVGHSVSAMIGVLSALRDPELFSALILVGPSPRYVDDAEYRGGFSRADIDDMLESLDVDFFAWSAAMAPVIAGNPERPEFGRQLTETFCRSDPAAARQFARVTFFSDNRDDLSQIRVPTLVMQCSEDPIAPSYVGEFVHNEIPHSRLIHLQARGHCPNLTAPEETADAIRAFLS